MNNYSHTPSSPHGETNFNSGNNKRKSSTHMLMVIVGLSCLIIGIAAGLVSGFLFSKGGAPDASQSPQTHTTQQATPTIQEAVSACNLEDKGSISIPGYSNGSLADIYYSPESRQEHDITPEETICFLRSLATTQKDKDLIESLINGENSRILITNYQVRVSQNEDGNGIVTIYNANEN